MEEESRQEEESPQKYLQAVTKKLVTLTAICLLILIITYIVPMFPSGRTFLVGFVFFSGLLGGFVSIQQRLPTISLKELKELSGSWLSILLIPINGGIFAMVLMLMFLSGLLDGPLFPKYKHVPLDHTDLVKSFINWSMTTFPEQGTDVAKLLFWSFVAGFSERFVPQIIRKTAERVDKKNR